MIGWQWHQLDHMQIAPRSRQLTMPVASTTSLKFFTGRMLFQMPNDVIDCNGPTTKLTKKCTNIAYKTNV